MFAATTFAAAMALMTEAGPLEQSPPANTPGMFSKAPLFKVTIFPRDTGIPAFSKCPDSISCPMALMRMSHGM